METKGTGRPLLFAAPSRVETDRKDADIKVILLGDSAVGKTKLIERYLMDDYHPFQLSTYALTLFRHHLDIQGKSVSVDFWDTAGQERFSSMHPSYYFGAHVCILVFDVTRKLTYQHMEEWYKELRGYCEHIPVLVVANKIDMNYEVTTKSFKFPSNYNLPLYYVSAADGTNVVKLFKEACEKAYEFKNTGKKDFTTEVLDLLRDSTFGDLDSS